MATRRSRRVRYIVLDKTKLGEQDLILTMLSQSGERVSAVARGARKPGGRLASRCDLFCEIDLLLAHGRGLEIVAEASLLDGHVGLRGDLARVSAASAVCEVARLTCFEEAEDPYLHPICSRALRACEEAEDQARLDVVVSAYVFKVLAHGGWKPELSRCVACGDEDVSHFSAAAGGVLCSSCARNVPGAEEMGRGDLEMVRALLSSTFDSLLAREVSLRSSTMLVGLAHVWAATHLDARLRALEFMLSV